MSGTKLLAVFAHPDDETFRCGGTLALLVRLGVRVRLLAATRGQAGSRGDPPLCSPEELPSWREKELRCACAALGFEPPILLDYQDGHLAEAEAGKIVAEILAVMRAFRPQVILTYGEDGVSGHPDHIAIGHFTLQAFRRSEYAAALYALAVPHSLAERLGMQQIHSVPDQAVTHSVDVSAAWEAKMTAIDCHRTQLGESPILQADPEKQRLFLGVEHFRLIEARPMPVSAWKREVH